MEKTIHSINGPVVTVAGRTDLSMMDMVYVGRERLIGEVIALEETGATIQVYEETEGLRIGEPVVSTGGPMCATLGPGILHSIFDGWRRSGMRTGRSSAGAYRCRR